MEMTEDEWFFDSISRYKNLNMFELEQPIQQVELVGTTSICVSCSNFKRHQLLELSLPSKLLSQTREPSDAVITSETDLKIKCGTFTEAMCYQIKTVEESKVIVSHVDLKGVTLYCMSTDSDEIKKRIFNIDYKFESPMMATSGSLMWLTKKRADDMCLFDMNTESCIYSVKMDERNSAYECDERIVPMFLRPDIVAFGRQLTGGVCFSDQRAPDTWAFEIAPYDESCNDRNFWCFTSLEECSEKLTDALQNICFAKLSKTGTLMVYDTRNIKVPAYIDKNLGLKSVEDAPLQMKFRPGNRDWISVSGFDGNVYVYQLHQGENPKQVFTHDGHKHAEGHCPQTVVTSHVWSQLENLLISTADNGTIQMWQFENKTSD